MKEKIKKWCQEHKSEIFMAGCLIVTGAITGAVVAKYTGDKMTHVDAFLPAFLSKHPEFTEAHLIVKPIINAKES